MLRIQLNSRVTFHDHIIVWLLFWIFTCVPVRVNYSLMKAAVGSRNVWITVSVFWVAQQIDQYESCTKLLYSPCIKIALVCPCLSVYALNLCMSLKQLSIVLLYHASLSTLAITVCNLCWWRFSFRHWRKHSLLWWWCHPLQLALVVFFLPPTGAHTPLALEQLALCGVVCGGGSCMWRWWL